MFRKENGVTLVALVITIIVLLILAGVTISMVLGDDGILSQAKGANTAQNKATVADQLSLAYATVRTEDIARKANVSTSNYKDSDVVFAQGIAVELAKSKAFDSVKISGTDVEVTLEGANGPEYFLIDDIGTTQPQVEDGKNSTQLAGTITTIYDENTTTITATY